MLLEELHVGEHFPPCVVINIYAIHNSLIVEESMCAFGALVIRLIIALESIGYLFEIRFVDRAPLWHHQLTYDTTRYK